MPSTKSVVISCAGIGSRLGLGQTKALIKIKGKSLIRWQLELLKDIEDVRIVVGFESNAVIEEVLKFRKDVIFVFNHNYFETKTGASLYLGSRHANALIIAWDGDLLVHPKDVNKCINTSHEYIGYSNKTSNESVFVITNNKNNVVGFSRENGDFEWTGPACIKKDKIKYTSGNVFNQIEKYLPMKGLMIKAQDIDTYEDYLNAIKFVKSWNK